MKTPSSNKPSLATARKSITLALNSNAKVPAKRTVVVLGVERGGTSMVAGVVRALGISMGQRAGLNHEDPLFLTDEQDRLENRIRMRNTQESVWGFKVPKASLMLDFYESHLRNPFYVVVYRNPMAIVDSWLQRGAENNPLGVMDRILSYQTAILDLMRKTSAPVLMINYERALQGEAARSQTVEEMAAFLGIDLTDELLTRATGMMTGDGKGYVNLPEHFFAVAPAREVEVGAELAMVPDPQGQDEDGWTFHSKVAPRLIFTPENGGKLPTSFVMDLDFDDGGSMDLASNPLRVYFNFIGEYFPGHCARPPVQVGKNRYLIETSGRATALALGPLEPGARFKASVRFHSVIASA